MDLPEQHIGMCGGESDPDFITQPKKNTINKRKALHSSNPPSTSSKCGDTSSRKRTYVSGGQKTSKKHYYSALDNAA